MITKLAPRQYFWIALISILTSCAPVTISDLTAIPPALEMPTESPILPSPVAFPTFRPFPTATVTPTLLPLPAELPKFPLDGYVMLFIKDGDLYFRDGENTPIKLTYVGGKHATPHTAILSDDGKKVVFFREGNYRDIYSINVDESHEQMVVQDRPLAEYTGAYSQFIPNTHLLLFNTYKCEMQGETILCAMGLSSVDTDTAEIKELVKPDKVGPYTTVSNFSVSPDGKLIAVEYPGYIDILDINGKAIRRNVIPYIPSQLSYKTFPFPNEFWLPDSSGLTVIVPDSDTVVAGFDVPAYSVWRYDINTAVAARISFSPSLVDNPVATCGGYHVSPDGKWILYYGSQDYTRDPLGGTYSLYIGDLRNGQVQRYDTLYCKGPSWGPDSRFFFYGNVLGAMDKPPIGIMTPEFMRWVDNLHFIFSDDNHETLERKALMAEIRGDIVVFFDLGIRFFDLVTINLKR